MNSKYLEKLEFNKIKNLIHSYAVTYLGKNLVNELEPYASKKDVTKALNQTFEASTLLFRKGSIPLQEVNDLEIYIKKLESSNFLNTIGLLEINKILRMSHSLKEYFSKDDNIDMSEFTNVNDLFMNLYSNDQIENTISKSIIDENTISDDASKELKEIRRNITKKENEIKAKLNSYTHSKYVQESVVTIRNNRYVIPVKNEYRSEVKGFIHDTSGSGSTVFIEPMAIFDLNNDISDLKIEEQNEIEKILQKLSSLLFPILDNIKNDINLIGLIDFIFAKAKYSNTYDGIVPTICEEKEINLINAYHPLLNKDEAIKNTITIGNEYNSLIITGPNTGGKTVTLKTIGLLCLMAISGILIPAKEGSKLYLFDNVFVDIGDEQNIQDSLSTFSSHIVNISKILENATSDSLVLIDELGSGTDPLEGAALGISILEYLNKKDILTISTTHHPEIKEYALLNKGFKNASVEFDINNLSPTYKLLIGVPGTSNAFNISKKLGISEEIIENAKKHFKNDKVSFEELLTSIYKDKELIEKEKEEIQKDYLDAENYKKRYQERFNDLISREKEIIEKSKQEARDIILDAKEEANEIIKELEKEKTNSKEANKLRNKLNDKLSSLSSISDDEDEESSKETILRFDELKEDLEVYIPKLDQYGTISKITNENNIFVNLPLGKMNFKLQDLKKSTRIKTKNIPKKNHSEFAPKEIKTEINLLGLNVEEACYLIDGFLDKAFLGGLSEVRIVHGKGTGALREGIHKYLKTHPHVKSFRLGTFGEGEMGVTIVELK